MCFWSLKFQSNLELVPLRNFDQFSSSSLKMYEFSHFNKILLSLSNVSRDFMIVFELCTSFDHFSLKC